MGEKIRGAVVAQNIVDGISQKIGEAGTGVVIDDNVAMIRRARLTLTAFAVAIAAGNDYGGTKLVDLPDRNIMLLGMEVDCVITKQGNTNGVVAATDITVAIGTAVASNSTLSGAMVDTIEAASLTTDALAVDFEAHSNNQSTATFPRRIADSPTAALYLNVAGAITADSSVTVNGYIDIFYLDLGNLSS